MTTLILCKGRHEMPIQAPCVYKSIENPMDFEGLQQQANAVISSINDNNIVVYVTGLTVALVAVINACREFSKTLTLMHFNRDNGEYKPQKVL